MSTSKTTTSAPTILDRLASGGPLISDGATGSYLQDHGLEPGGCPEELNASRPDLIRQMEAEYFDAGSDMVLTSSFGGSRFMLKKYGYEDRVQELNRLAVENARSVAPEGRYVVGSVGPTGELLESNFGTTPDREVYDAFVEQITVLDEAGADGVDIETMISAEEAVLAVKAAKQHADLVVMSTLMFDKGPRGWFTMMGDTPEVGVKKLVDAGANVVGANCGSGIDRMVEVARQIREATDGYVLIHSNAGIPTMKDGRIVYLETPEFMAERFQVLADLGINIVGGCCGTTPQHIRALSETVRGTG
jgi:5-methyltetrahydrofolate--homocysteine methyltransferase